MVSHRHFSFATGRPAWIFVAMLLLAFVPAHAAKEAILANLVLDPAIIKQGDGSQSIVKTVVTLQAPSPDYFVCEVRCEDRRKIDAGTIIFRKGDTVGKGTATIFWDHIDADSTIKVSAFNVNTPDAQVTFTASLQVKTGN